MRANDRDLIRGGHYGQRSCEPHSKAEHMAAPTNAALVKITLANAEPSTHDPKQTYLFQIVSLSRYDAAPETGSSNEAARVHHLGG